MKVAIPSEKPEMGSAISQIFGRCPYFMIVEIEAGKIVKSEAVLNPGINQPGGAGMAAAQELSKQGAKTLIANRVGPKAAISLESIEMEIYTAISGTVQENVDAFMSGNLSKANPKIGFFKE